MQRETGMSRALHSVTPQRRPCSNARQLHLKGNTMSAYVVVEATVRDADARDRYSSKIEATMTDYGGEILLIGPWQVLFGDPEFTNGMIIRFPDREAALAWYHSPSYQDLVELRTAALDCRFRLVG
jgi:uncharacterized protein (DUF1330 family)